MRRTFYAFLRALPIVFAALMIATPSTACFFGGSLAHQQRRAARLSYRLNRVTTRIAARSYATSQAPAKPLPAPQQPAPVVPAPARPGATSALIPGTGQIQVSDSYGFTAWLNATRARYGLAAVAYDPNLSYWSSVNNYHQRSRGMGHFVMGPARRQNAAMRTDRVDVVQGMWLASPAHRSALLDPSIRAAGIHYDGLYWTYSAY